MSDKKREHLWIPDEEVIRLDKTLTARNTPRNISYGEHGKKLSASLQAVKQALENVATEDSLVDTGLMIFKIELPEGEKIKDKKDLFTSTGMQVKAVKSENKAVISTTKSQFQLLKKRLDDYTATGTGKTYFDYVEDFKAYIGTEKNSSALQKTTCQDTVPSTLDVQLMLVPNLGEDINRLAIHRLADKISGHGGSIQEEPYYLSDSTPVIRAIIPSNSLFHFENDSAIYRIEETDFFSADAASKNAIDLNALELDDSILVDTLPIVTVLDSGVNFPIGLKPLVVEHWVDGASLGGDTEHGTKVASRVAFKYIFDQLPGIKVVPRTRIIDCNILDGSVPVNIFIKRIQNAVAAFKDISKIYNLSANASTPIEGDEMSIIGYELDELQLKHNVQFVISAGNHQLWSTESRLEDILGNEIAKSFTAYWNGSAYVTDSSIGFGYSALRYNTGAQSNGVGGYALFNNTGVYSNGVGGYALYNNTGVSSNGFGGYALYNNTGVYSNGFGHNSLFNNTGVYSNGFGYDALQNNTGANNTALGYNSFNAFIPNPAGAKSCDYTAIDTTLKRAIVTAHGFGANGAYTLVNYSTTGTAIGGMAVGTVQIKIIDANTIEFTNGSSLRNITSQGTGTHTFTPSMNYSNTTSLGASTKPNRSNQVVLGSTAVNSFRFGGTFRTPASSSDTGVVGEFCYDSNYLYLCTAINTWKRVALGGETW